MGVIIPAPRDLAASKDVSADQAARPAGATPFEVEHLLAERMLDMLDQTGRGGVMLDPSGHVAQLNRRARRHIGQGIVLVSGRLVASHRNANAALQSLIEAVLRSEESRSAVALPRFRGRPLIAQAMPMAGSGPAAPRYAGAVLTLSDPDEDRVPSESILRQAFALTPAEMRIAVGLCRGLSPQEIADAHGVSVSTVRIQLKTIFAKTDTHRQAELTALLIRLALIDSQARVEEIG